MCPSDLMGQSALLGCQSPVLRGRTGWQFTVRKQTCALHVVADRRDGCPDVPPGCMIDRCDIELRAIGRANEAVCPDARERHAARGVLAEVNYEKVSERGMPAIGSGVTRIREGRDL